MRQHSVGSRANDARVLVLAALLLVTVLSSCVGDGPPPTPRYRHDATAAGVVSEVRDLPDGGREIIFDDGRVLLFGPATQRAPAPEVGNLVLYAPEPGNENGPYSGVYRVLLFEEPGCWRLSDSGMDDGTHIHFYEGLRIPKAPDFDPGLVENGRFSSIRAHFCVDREGRATSYEHGR